jgi:hypothetical protein
LNADHLVAGANYVQTVYLVQDQPNEDLAIRAVLAVPNKAAAWISLDTGFSFVIPKGTRQFPVQITVQVPDGEGIGRYSGNLSFTSQPTQTGQVTIALGVNVAINLTVGTGIFEQFSVPQIKMLDIEEGWNPKVDVSFKNDGNIPESFDAATFDIFDQYDNVHLAQLQKQDGFTETPPFSTNDYIVEFPTDFHFGIGQYWGNVVFYQNSKVIASQKTIFHVLKAGSIVGPWMSALYALQKSGWLNYIGIAILIVVVALIAMVWRSKRKRRRSSSKA